MSKKVAFGARPSAVRADASKADEWVNNRDPEAMKRLTIDVPASLHARIKSQCALRGVKMADEVRELLEKHFQSS
ncbi:MAG: hypothetical protein RKO24_06170 [Candidatus Competibacter sp.]|jgi:hypothetical protein|nr:hypothetical protein [Candidatus Contendobacter sp.]MDS4069188.1 hypothetical protein [Candidatus Competibacter sp.]